MADSKVKGYVCTRVLPEDGETSKTTHIRVVALGDYDAAMLRIDELEATQRKACEDLRRCTTLAYRSDNARSLGQALDKVCDGVSAVIADLNEGIACAPAVEQRVHNSYNERNVAEAKKRKLTART